MPSDCVRQVKCSAPQLLNLLGDGRGEGLLKTSVFQQLPQDLADVS